MLDNSLCDSPSELRAKSKTRKQPTLICQFQSTQCMKAWAHMHVHIIIPNLSLQKRHRVSSSKPVISSDESLIQTAASFFSPRTHTQICLTSSCPTALVCWVTRLACAMPTEAYDAQRPSPQRWVSLGGERVRAARAPHWVMPLKWRGLSEKWVFCFGSAAGAEAQV